MSEFISPIAPLIRAFVAFRKASRRWNEASYEVNLSLFDKYCDKNFPNISELSQDMADSWCAQRKTEANNKMWRQHNRGYVVPYEIRHNYAVENINGWTGIGFDFNAKLLYLSKSMGHSVLVPSPLKT